VKLITPYSLLLGLLVTGPGLWAAFVDPDVAVAPAVIHFILASLIAGAGIAFVSALVKTYAEGNERKNRPTSDEDILDVDEAPAATAEDELLAS
jgi:hypothetical protein